MLNPDDKVGRKQLKNRVQRERTQGHKLVKDNEREIKELERTVKDRFQSSGHAMSVVYARVNELTRTNETIKKQVVKLDKFDPESFAAKEQLESIVTWMEHEKETFNQGLADVRGEMERKFAELDAKNIEQDGRLNAHTSQIGMLEEGQQSLHRHLTKVTKDHTTLERRVSVIDGGAKFPLVRLLIAIVVGVIVGLMWDAGTFKEILAIPYTDNVTLTYSFAESPLGAILAGLAAGLITLGILSLFPAQPKKVKREETERTTETTTHEAHGATDSVDPSHNPTPPTRVHPAVADNGGR